MRCATVGAAQIAAASTTDPDPPSLSLPDYLTYWGKATPTAPPPSPRWHPVVHHCLDVAASVAALLATRPGALARGAALLRLPPNEAERLLVALAALHDLGKFAPAFQAKVIDHWPARLGVPPAQPPTGRHTDDGLTLWQPYLLRRTAPRLWPGAEGALRVLGYAVFGHHGAPVGPEPGVLAARFPRAALDDATAAADALLALLAPQPLASAPLDPDDARIASWWVAGLLVTADWVGSGERWFAYTAPRANDPTLAAYWAHAQRAARRAVREAGLTPPAPAPACDYPALLGRTPWTPTPAQRWAAAVPLPDGPVLFLLEDVTGAGKTEAAHMLVHRLLAAGRAGGAYWAMPTQATANAMYARQARVLDRLFAPGTPALRPSLVLAHGQQWLHDGFRATVLDGAAPAADAASLAAPRPGGAADTLDDVPGTATCAAFLADDRRAALLADVGAGTVDQALLGVLPSRFNALRLFALSDRVLVVDEAHAYDAYTGVEVRELLRFHAALGGSAIVLSATLPGEQREDLCDAWRDGLRLAGGPVPAAAPEPTSPAKTGYPLATVASAAGVHRQAVDAAPWSARTVDVRLEPDVEAACAHLAAAAKGDAAVAWIRNTVDDCLAAAAMLRAREVEPLVFHARFAQGDRQAREREVLERLGAEAPVERRRGCVLVATQVAEQSLDFDVDAMVSDVAPVDLLIQRAGRLWRHERHDAGGRAGCARALWVLAPPYADDPPADWLGGPFRGTAHVYADAGVLWRTVRALADVRAIVTPGGLRPLVEAVYSSDEVPAALQRAADRAKGQELTGAAAATYGTLKVPVGYDASQSAWVSDLRVPTRLGDEPTTLRLARALPDGALAPWCDDPVPRRAWALSEVRVRRSLVPPDARVPERWAPAVEAVRQGFGRWDRDAVVAVLAPHEDSLWRCELRRADGRPIRLRYGAAAGLERDA